MTVVPFAMHAGARDVADLRIGKGLFIGKLIDAHPGNAVQLIGLVFLKGDIIFGHASHHTGAATRAFVQIDHHSKFFGFYVLHQNLFGLTMLPLADIINRI